MKKLALTYYIALCATVITMIGETHNNDTDLLPIQEQTFLVYRRYYFVARLDKTIQLLAKMYHEVSVMQEMLTNKQIMFDEIVPEGAYQLFAHKQIRASVKEIAHTRSFKPLFMVWDSFKSYKSLHDDLLVEDFSKEIFIITRNTIDSLHKHNAFRAYHMKNPNTLGERLDALTDMTYILENIVLIGRSEEILFRNNDVGSVHLAVRTDEVAFRFYCIHRFRKALDYLLSLPESNLATNLVCASLQNRCMSFQDNKSQKISPHKGLKHVWDDIVQYKHVENEEFVHHFAVYTLMLMYCNVPELHTFKSLSHADLIAMQHRIEQLPLEEILQAIDLIVKQVQTAVGHYHKSGLTLTQWIKQYWWAPTAICATVAIKFFMLYYKNFRTP